MNEERIRHTVAFALVHPEGSAEERDFLDAAERLATIPGVEMFELLSEVSPKKATGSGSRWSSPTARPTTRYNEHPDHVRFVRERWLSEVSEFLELDYAAP